MLKKIKLSEDLVKRIDKEAEKCVGCNLCMENCPMLDEFCSTPKKLLEDIRDDKELDIRVPYSCALCDYCTQVCPKDVDLKDVFYSLRVHAIDTLDTLPKELGHSSVKFHQDSSFSKLFSTEIRGLDDKNKRKIFFPGCSLSSYSPEIMMNTYEYLKEKLPGIGIALKCCGNPTYSMGEKDRFDRLYSSVQNEFKDKGVEEVIVACQNCYSTISRNSPDIKVTSIWEVIAQHGVPDDKKEYYRSIEKAFSIHDPCPTRRESGIHDAIREITSQLSLNIIEMEFIREKTLCCGSGAMIGVTSKKLSLQQKRKRADQSKSDCIVTYCEECVESMKAGGKESIHLLDLLFDPYIEEKFNQKNVRVLKKWSNRYRSKRRISRYGK